MPVKRISHSEDWWVRNTDATVVRCHAALKIGGQCRREALLGMSVCANHGGSIPAVMAKANAALGELANPALREIGRILNDPSASDADKLRASASVLDRLGVNSAAKYEVSVNVDPVEALFKSLLSDPDALLEAPALTAEQVGEGAPLLALENGAGGLDDVVDAELVPDSKLHTVAVDGSKSSRPPRHLELDLERTLKALI